MVGNIGYTLEVFHSKIGSDALLPTTSGEIKVEVFRALIWSYSNLRGKDYAYKKNAAAGPNTKQTLRAKLAVALMLAKERRIKSNRAKSQKHNKTSDSPPTFDDNTDNELVSMMESIEGNFQA